MKKVYYLVTDEKQNFIQKVAFMEKSRDVKSQEGYVTTLKSERAKHPKPSTLVEVLTDYGVDIAEFYEKCDLIENPVEAVEKPEKEGDNQ